MNLDKDLEEIKLREKEIIKLLTELVPKIDCKCVRENLELLDKKKMTLKFKEPYVELGTLIDTNINNSRMNVSPLSRHRGMLKVPLIVEVSNAKEELFLKNEVLHTFTKYENPPDRSLETRHKFVTLKIIVDRTSLINGSGVLNVSLVLETMVFIFDSEIDDQQYTDTLLRRYITLDQILPANLEVKYRGNILKPNFIWRK